MGGRLSALSEDVLRDLLLELGVEGVTLWHIRAMAAAMRQRNGAPVGWWHLRLGSDLRGETEVLREAYDRWSLNMHEPALGSDSHDDGCNCSQCEAVEFQRREAAFESEEFNAANSRGD